MHAAFTSMMSGVLIYLKRLQFYSNQIFELVQKNVVSKNKYSLAESQIIAGSEDLYFHLNIFTFTQSNCNPVPKPQSDHLS